jgi:ABC-type uncharacterized transport system substrate-binding protein
LAVGGCGAAAGPTLKRVALIVSGAEADPQMQILHSLMSQELQRLGWVVGRDVQIDIRYGGNDNQRYREATVELIANSADILVCSGTQATAIVKELTRTIPIVFVNVADPAVSGFVASFAHPGGNITGSTSVEHSLAGKWASVLRDVAPAISRVMVLFNPENTNWMGYLPAVEAAAAQLKFDVAASRFATREELTRAIVTFAGEPGGGMIVLPAGTTVHRELIASLAAQHRLPAIYPYDYYAEAGGLVSYGSDSRDIYRRAASYVDRIMRGEKPADLPVQAPVKFELVVNLKAAKAIGLDIPYNVLILANRVID